MDCLNLLNQTARHTATLALHYTEIMKKRSQTVRRSINAQVTELYYYRKATGALYSLWIAAGDKKLEGWYIYNYGESIQIMLNRATELNQQKIHKNSATIKNIQDTLFSLSLRIAEILTPEISIPQLFKTNQL